MDGVNFYCDESCHVWNDGFDIMTLCGVIVKQNHLREINKDIRAIKAKHNIDPFSELKWTKVSNSNLNMYKDIITYIKDSPSIHIRNLVARGKSLLKFPWFGTSYDDWYYKMYYTMLVKPLQNELASEKNIKIIVDIKDTHSFTKTKKLELYLNNKFLNDKKICALVSFSDKHELMQVSDIIAGAASYKNRNLKSSESKLSLISYIERSFGVDLCQSSYLKDIKFNNFIWQPTLIFKEEK
ncbi:TPA: DUF3800 domain-containing protein [bacterium]|nr:DUF3800 domain-containing protein [bacterium]